MEPEITNNNNNTNSNPNAASAAAAAASPTTSASKSPRSSSDSLEFQSCVSSEGQWMDEPIVGFVQDDDKVVVGSAPAAVAEAAETTTNTEVPNELEYIPMLPSELNMTMANSNESTSMNPTTTTRSRSFSSSSSSSYSMASPSSSISCWEQVLFFGCGLGSSLGYIATLSALVYFKVLYGANSFVDLNLAVYLPLLPISLAQAKWDQYYDQQYQSRRTFLVRGIVAYSMIIWGTIGMVLGNTSTSARGGIHPMLSSSSSSTNDLNSVIRNALWQGTGSAILYGTLNQMASFVASTSNTSGSPSPRNQRNESNNNNNNSNSNSLKATVSAGVQASALLVLAISLETGFNGETEQGRQQFGIFLWNVVLVEIICFIMFLWLLLRRPLVVRSMRRRDYSLQMENAEANDNPEDQANDDDDDNNNNNNNTNHEAYDEETGNQPEEFVEDTIETPLLNNVHDNNSGNVADNSPPLRRRLFPSSPTQRDQHDDDGDDDCENHRQRQQQRSGRNTTTTSTTNTELSYRKLWNRTKYCCFILLATLIPSFLVGSWFTRVETDWMELAQILFYVRIAADFMGRLATIWFPPKSISCLYWTTIVRYIPVVSFFFNSKKEGFERILGKFAGISNAQDYLSILFVTIIAFQSGYLVTGCFQLAPNSIPLELRESNQAKQASLLTVAFSVAAIMGLLSSFTLIALGV